MRNSPWLRCLLLAALAAAGTVRGRAEEFPQKFGKTNAEILAMGVDQWLELHGGGTSSQWEALAAYRSALRWRNDHLAARVSPGLRRRVDALRPLLARFAEDLHSISSYLAGGGTIWIEVEGRALVDSEETLYALLGGKVEPARPLVVSAVTKELDALEKAIADASGDDSSPRADRPSALAALASIRATFDRSVKITATFDRQGSDRILAFYLDQLEADPTS